MYTCKVHMQKLCKMQIFFLGLHIVYDGYDSHVTVQKALHKKPMQKPCNPLGHINYFLIKYNATRKKTNIAHLHQINRLLDCSLHSLGKKNHSFLFFEKVVIVLSSKS